MINRNGAIKIKQKKIQNELFVLDLVQNMYSYSLFRGAKARVVVKNIPDHIDPKHGSRPIVLLPSFTMEKTPPECRESKCAILFHPYIRLAKKL